MAEKYYFFEGAPLGSDPYATAKVTYSSENTAITRDEIDRTFENEEAKITMPLGYYPASEFVEFNPSEAIYLIITNNDKPVFFGRVANCEFNLLKGTAKLTLMTLKGMMKTNIPNRIYSRSCPFEFCGSGCGLVLSDFETIILKSQATLDSTGRYITSDVLKKFSSGYFSGGYIQSGLIKSYIMTHTNNQIELLYPVTLEDRFRVYPGCKKSTTACKAYGNINNFGGFPFVPKKHPVQEGF